MTAGIKGSVANRGELVTYRSPLGGVGLARLVDGTAYSCGENGYFYPLDAYYVVIRDGGKLYRAATARVNLPY